MLVLRRSGHTTIPTRTDAFWPSWSPSGKRIAYSPRLTPGGSEIYTVALDGPHKRLVARNGAAPAWSPDGRTIAYQSPCGIRLITPSGRNGTPSATANACGAIGFSAPPTWSPDGTKLAFETKTGIYVIDKSGRALRLVQRQAINPGSGVPFPPTTWCGQLPARPAWQPMH